MEYYYYFCPLLGLAYTQTPARSPNRIDARERIKNYVFYEYPQNQPTTDRTEFTQHTKAYFEIRRSDRRSAVVEGIKEPVLLRGAS
jgi:hypothetical protein